MKLESLVSVLNPEEKNVFLNYLERQNKRKDTKNKELFLLLDRGVPSKEIPKRLYGSDNKRAYHALRIRLQKNVIDFLGQEGLQSEALEEVSIYKLVFLGRKFLQKQHYEIGMEFLLLAKEKAMKVQHYVLLNEIYHSLVQYSYASDLVDVNDLIKMHGENASFLIQEERLNVVYALIQNRLRDHQHGRLSSLPENLIQDLIAEYKLDLETFTTFKALFQFIKIHLAVAQAKNYYYGFIENIVKQYRQVESLQEETDRQMFYHIRLLYSISNTFFRIKRFDDCAVFVSKLQELIFTPNFPYKERFQYKYVIMASLNANYSGDNRKAIELVEQVNFSRINNLKDKYDLRFCLILFYIHGNELSKAKTLMSKMFHTDRYYEERMGIDWLMKLKLIEIILYFEMNESDLVESRIRSFKRSFIPYLKKQGQIRVVNFFKLVERIFLQPEIATHPDFHNSIDGAVGRDPMQNEDVFVQSYFGWMKAKMFNRDIYEVTLELAK